MDKTINVMIKNKIAVQTNDLAYVCNNSDFVIIFDFDGEWDEFAYKTARFVYDDSYTDVLFTGNQCTVPLLSDTRGFLLGVFAGNLRTTTPVYIRAAKSILCEHGSPVIEAPDAYGQMMEVFLTGMEKIEEVNKKADDTEQAKLDAQAAQKAAENAEQGAELARKGIEETLTATTKEKEAAEQARQGAEAALQTVENGFVSYLEQDKTDEEKAQARKNIDVVETWDDLVDKPFSKTELGDTLTWDGNTDGLVKCNTFYRVFCFVKDIAKNIELFNRDNVAYLESDGGTYGGNYLDQKDNYINFGGRVIITLEDDVYVPYCGMSFPKKGVYFYKKLEGADAGFVWVSSFTVSGFNFTTEEMNEELLPDTVVQNGDKELILTSPNGLLFRITVDNNGTISAAQVTN